jgi:hypothetical protein
MSKKTKKELKELTKAKLKELAEQANKHHKEVKPGLLNVLEHARQCGKILIQAKKLVKHGSWKRWLRQNVGIISYETAVNYMRVAREKGDGFDSIESILAMYRKKRKKDETPKLPVRFLSAKEKLEAYYRECLTEAFKYWVPNLLKELDVFQLILFGFQPLRRWLVGRYGA